jgi:hypothetical protein
MEIETTRQPRLPATVMMWTINDAVMEEPETLVRQFHDIRQAGFGGVAALVRCSRYTWDHLPAMDALRHISRLCRQYGMGFWIGPDARTISRALIGDGQGLTVLAYGEQIKASQVPHWSPVIDNRYSIRCAIPSRPAHTMFETAVDYYPVGLFKVFALCAKDLDRKEDVVDITETAHFFYNAREKYVEAFGRFQTPENESWHVVAFFELRTSHVDFTNPHQSKGYVEKLQTLLYHVAHADGLIWDEPGFTCMYGSLPFSASIARRFLQKSGHSLSDVIWKMAIDCQDGSHLRVRNCYFSILQETMIRLQQQSRACGQAVWGAQLLTGIHDTWHFESADMCDMNHGSLDLWKSLAVKSGGFVDLGGVQELRQSDSPCYANLAAMTAIARSLAKYSSGGFAFNNLWTMGEDNGSNYQTGVLDHCVKIMRLFSQRWLAHIYGPAGTVGEENSFLGSIPLPGYPRHSTWPGFSKWSAQLAEHLHLVSDRLPWANILMVFPVETMYGLANHRADTLAMKLFQLLLYLTDHHFHVDIVSSTIAGNGKWQGEQFVVHGYKYDILLLPSADTIADRVLKKIRRHVKKCFFVFSKPVRDQNGVAVDLAIDQVYGIQDLADALAALAPLQPVQAPADSWVSLTPGQDGEWIALAPARHGLYYSGQVSYKGKAFSVQPTSDLVRIFFPHHGDPHFS